MPQRISEIKNWLITELKAELHSFEVASNDASFRRYFRVAFKNSIAGQTAGQTFVVMDAPPEKEAIEAFIDIASCLEECSVHVPHLYAVNKPLGFILMSDLGSTDYLSVLKGLSGNDRVDSLYSDAIHTLLLMQKGLQQQTLELADYSASLLRSEMQLLPDWYIKKHCQHTLTDAEQTTLDDAMQRLIQSAQEQPQVFVHRDYHSRNLMLCDSHNPAVIDFQDAVLGPITYDLVSLLRDSYIVWPQEKVYHWLEDYRQILLKEGLLKTDDKDQFVRWFDWMGIQRQLKVVGIFCRLNYRDGKSHYLDDIPQTLDYLVTVCSRYSEFQALQKLLLRLAA